MSSYRQQKSEEAPYQVSASVYSAEGGSLLLHLKAQLASDLHSPQTLLHHTKKD